MFVRGPISVLVLASDAAVRAFLRLVDRLDRMDKIDVEGLVEELRAFEEEYRLTVTTERFEPPRSCNRHACTTDGVD